MIGWGGRSAGLAALALMAAALAGCASRPAPITCLPPGRSLVLARVVTDENRANQEAVADLLVNALRDAGYVIGSRELLAEARAVGLGAWAGATLERVQRGAVLSAEEGRVMAERFDVRTLVATDLNEYDQVWGKYAKFTRAGSGCTCEAAHNASSA